MKRKKNTTIMPATESVLDAVQHLDDAVGRFIKMVPQLRNIRRYEAHSECITLGWVLCRHVEGIYELAKTDLVLIPAAHVVARAALETAGKILWMLKPEDVMEREARWLTHLAGEADYYERLAAFMETQNQPRNDLKVQASQIKDFHAGVAGMLPEGIKPKAAPKFRELLKDVGKEDAWSFYIKLSQYSHAGSATSLLYRKNLGTAKKIGEQINPEMWALPLGIAWFCISHAGMEIATKLGGQPDVFASPVFLKRGNDLIKQLSPSA